MNKLICLVVPFCMSLAAIAQPATIYLNSETVTCTYPGKTSECLQYKYKPTDTAWSVYKGGTIKGFTYNPGYFNTLQVRPLPRKRQQWSLVKMINKTKSTVQQQPSDSVAGADTSIKPPAQLIGQWKFSKLTAGGKETALGVNNEMLQFDAVALRVNGKLSCNRFFANYTTAGAGQIKFEAIGGTRMACEALATETMLLKAMELVNAWRLTDNVLRLTTADGMTVELTKAAPVTPSNGGGN